MPKLQKPFIQEAMPLYPIVKELDSFGGVMQADLSDLPQFDPDQRITLGRLASSYGQRIGPLEATQPNEDTLLEVVEKDFAAANPSAIVFGLYISPVSTRFNHPQTEQLVRLRPPNKKLQAGVVFPVDEFHLVARSASDLVNHTMAKTRKANMGENDSIVVEGRVGRSAAHVMETKIQGLNALENRLIDDKRRLIDPLARETFSVWQSHFKAKNLDKKRKEFDEKLHFAVETASLNLDLGTKAVKAAHRAVTSNMYRKGSSKEILGHWLNYLQLLSDYINARQYKVDLSRSECKSELADKQAFLDAKAEADGQSATAA